MKTVVGIGEILWDIFPEYKQLGGAPANFAIHSASLGHRGLIISQTGNDISGREIREHLENKNIEYILPVDEEHKTGQVTVTLNKDGHPSYIIHENAAWDHLTLTPEMKKAAEEADAVCYGSLAHRHPDASQAILSFLDCTRDECIKVFDINLRQNYHSKQIIEQLLLQCQVFKLSDEELPVVCDYFSLNGTEESQIKQLITQFHLDMVVLTKGGKGSTLISADGRRSDSIPPETCVRDTVGAGDSFTAAVVSGLLKNWDLDKINRFAQSVASYVCTCHGATPVLPSSITNVE